MKTTVQNRLNYELKNIKKYNQLSVKIAPNNNYIWYVSFKGAEKTLYENEIFTLKFQFDDGYVIINNLIFFYSHLKDQQ